MDFGQIWSSQVAMGAEAPAAPAAASVKLSIAVVDMQKAILQTEEGKAAKVKIEKDAQSKRDALIKQQDDLNALGQEFQSQQSVLSDESKLERQKEIQSKMQALRTAQISFEQEVRRKEMEETQKIIESLQKIIDEMSRKKGYDFVFERNAGALLYAPSVEDITDEVVKLYNGRSSSKPAKGTKK
jgi:outer membrane protein